ncbi:YALIA101S15e00452g1_1 [Yarrowia lipolytica]|nr:YALIA101S15e00452g1_1 [Yarrowia lipolytica]
MAQDAGLDLTNADATHAHAPPDSGSQGDGSAAHTEDADAAGKGETSGDILAASDEHADVENYELDPAARKRMEAAVRARKADVVEYLNYLRLLQDAVPNKLARTDALGSKTDHTRAYGDSRQQWEDAIAEQEEQSSTLLNSQHRKRMWGHLAKVVRSNGRGVVMVDYHGSGGDSDHYTGYRTTTVMDANGKEWLPSVPLPSLDGGFSALTVSVVGPMPAESATDKEWNSAPERYRQAMALPDKDHWLLAMNEEMDSIKSNEVFEWVDSKDVEGKKVLPSRWVYNRKFNLDGSLERYKARVVAKGFVQEANVDYLMSFSPVIRFESVRFLLAFAAFKQWNIYQMDVKTAFLYGDIDTTTYMKPPEGFSHPKDPTKVWKLKKSLYGLVQAPRCWNQKLHEVLTKFGLERHQSEHGLYSNKPRKLFVGVYVDDLLITGANTKEVSKLKKYLTDNFKMKDLGLVSKFLGMQVSKDKRNHSFSLDMDGYIKQMDKDLDIPVKYKVLVPLDPKDLEKLKEDSPLTDATVYRQGIGKLSYLAHAVRIDIAHAVNFLATFNQAPCETHQFLLHKLLRYVCDTKDYKLTYVRPKGPMTPLVFTDANWGSGYPDHDKTYEGMLVLICGGPVCWRSSKQKSIALSTAEAEYMALSEGTKTAMWLTEVYEDFGIPMEPKAVGILVDNQAAIQIANDPQFYPRTKHIKRRYHFTREAVNNSEITVSFVETGNQLADFLTKPLVWTTLNPTLLKIGMNAKTGCS